MRRLLILLSPLITNHHSSPQMGIKSWIIKDQGLQQPTEGAAAGEH